MTTPAKSPRQDAKAVIEAWVELDGDLVVGLYDSAASAKKFSTLGTRIVRLTSAPPTAPDGRVEETTDAMVAIIVRALEMAGKFVEPNIHELAEAYRGDVIKALTPAKKGRVKP